MLKNDIDQAISAVVGYQAPFSTSIPHAIELLKGFKWWGLECYNNYHYCHVWPSGPNPQDPRLNCITSGADSLATAISLSVLKVYKQKFKCDGVTMQVTL